jgi:poly-D-alanine transfer protein DltD
MRKVTIKLVETSATKKISFTALQKLIYTFVVEKMKLSSGTKKEALYLLKDTDELFTSFYDELYEELADVKDGYKWKSLKSSILDCILGLSEDMVDYFKESMNFEPGHKVEKLTRMKSKDITEEELKELASKMTSVKFG